MTQTPEQQCEIAWFSALCDDDYEFLGVPDPYLQSSWEHCRNLVMRAEEGGFDNILLPSGYSLGLDTTAFAAAVAAYGQVLRGDEMMLGFGFDDIGRLAGSQDNFWRQEFLQLNQLAASMKGG